MNSKTARRRVYSVAYHVEIFPIQQYISHQKKNKTNIIKRKVNIYIYIK